MSKTIIITDSGCDIPEHTEKIFSDNIKVISHTIRLTENEMFKDNLISKKAFSQNMAVGMRPLDIYLEKDDVLGVLNNLGDEYDQVIFITSSGMLYPENEVNIKEASLEYFANHINSRITVIDSNTTSMALGFLVLDAAEMIDMQYDYDEIVRYVKTNKSKYRMDFIANDSTIIREKRIISSRKSRLICSNQKKYLISMSRFGILRPIIGKTSDKEISDIMLDRLIDDVRYQYAIVTSSLNQDIEYYVEYIKEKLDIDPTISKFSCSNTSFVGTDTISLCYKKKK